MTNKNIEWQRGGKSHVWNTYAKLHEGRIGQHWLWAAIERIVAGDNEQDVMRDFGYEKSGCDYCNHPLFIGRKCKACGKEHWNDEEESALWMRPVCKRCGGQMESGKAIESTLTGSPDFHGAEVVTVYAGGPGKLIDCLKCKDCGWSIKP